METNNNNNNDESEKLDNIKNITNIANISTFQTEKTYLYNEYEDKHKKDLYDDPTLEIITSVITRYYLKYYNNLDDFMSYAKKYYDNMMKESNAYKIEIDNYINICSNKIKKNIEDKIVFKFNKLDLFEIKKLNCLTNILDSSIIDDLVDCAKYLKDNKNSNAPTYQDDMNIKYSKIIKQVYKTFNSNGMVPDLTDECIDDIVKEMIDEDKNEENNNEDDNEDDITKEMIDEDDIEDNGNNITKIIEDFIEDININDDDKN